MNRLFTAIALLGLSVLGSSCTCASKGDCCKKEGSSCCSKPAKGCCGSASCAHKH